MARTYRIILVVLISLLAVACASQNDLDAANARIAELERELSATASTTAPPPTTSTTTTPRVQTILGSAVATWSALGVDGCVPMEAPEIHEGASVVVRDASGIVIGATQLGDGESGSDFSCEFLFTVDVPANIDFYEFEVAQQSRAAYSNADLVSSDWQVSFLVD